MNAQYRKPWVQRHWLLMLVLSFVVMMALSMAIGVGVMYVVMSSVKSTAPYREAMERVRGDERMTRALGEPIGTRWIPLGMVEQREQGRAAFLVFLQGPRGTGTVDVQGVFTDGLWRYQRLQGETDGPPRDRVDLRRDVDH
jgi:hypothetical protein